jgi:hypothetical protein
MPRCALERGYPARVMFRAKHPYQVSAGNWKSADPDLRPGPKEDFKKIVGSPCREGPLNRTTACW